ncbi:hypothetical protein M231_05718 [Tremella mesenterica]|uniref:RING-type E3 ubiquitin transferase n=1 Tax=Tremella mesenterica TaxID=5217 RepID=A0A4Q1BHD8_TREME|nr:hypothetical protein M231_05718 [Tremella mesenterica]
MNKQSTDLIVDEAEGFLLQHALFSPPRAWPPTAPPPVDQSTRLAAGKKKMDWEDQVRLHPDEPMDLSWSKKEGDDECNKERCVICLMPLRDRTIVGVCGHEFCFECIGVWANQSRRCPLCSADMAPFLLHDLDAIVPIKFYLPPLPQRRPPTMTLPLSRLPGSGEDPRWGAREKAELDELDLQVERRREIYRHELYVKHIASNPTTGFRPNPSPREISDDPLLLARATLFMRRELRVWSLVDVEYLTTYILSLIKAIDIRSEPAVRLLADTLDTPDNVYPRGAEHFAHELYNFLRSPFKELRKYDLIAQYDPIPNSPLDKSPLRSISRHSSIPISPSNSFSSHSSLLRSPLSSFESSYKSQNSSSSSQVGRNQHKRSLSSSSSHKLESHLSNHEPSTRKRNSHSTYHDSPPVSKRQQTSPKEWSKHDTFIPPPSPGGRKWDESDSWVDPDYLDYIEVQRQREEERMKRRQAKRDRWQVGRMGSVTQNVVEQEKERIELLPSPPRTNMVDVDTTQESTVGILDNVDVNLTRSGGISIKGASNHVNGQKQKRLTLLERLAKAKSESQGLSNLPSTTSLNSNSNSNVQHDVSHISILDQTRTQAIEQENQTRTQTIEEDNETDRKPNSRIEEEKVQTKKSLKEMKRSRMKLRLKLENEKASYKFKTNQSRAYALRSRLLLSKARRAAKEEDSSLRDLDKVERFKEIRRRLMVLKMMQAETIVERRARELKAKLMEKRKGKGVGPGTGLGTGLRTGLGLGVEDISRMMMVV